VSYIVEFFSLLTALEQQLSPGN